MIEWQAVREAASRFLPKHTALTCHFALDVIYMSMEW